MENVSTRTSLLASPWSFFIAVFAWSWGFWLVVVGLEGGTNTATGMALALLGLLGPMVGGIFFARATLDTEGWRDYWRRLVDLRRISAAWMLVILFLAPVLLGLSAWLDILTGGDPEAYAEQATPFLANPLSLLPAALLVLMVGPLPEEFGWRGYVQDRLQERMNPVAASLVIGVIWGAWHLPLFFMEGTYQQEQGAFTLWFWTFMAGVVPLSVLMGWIYNATGRSTLAIVIFHFVVVFACNFLNATPGANVYSTVFWILSGIVAAVAMRRPVRVHAHAH